MRKQKKNRKLVHTILHMRMGPTLCPKISPDWGGGRWTTPEVGQGRGASMSCLVNLSAICLVLFKFSCLSE